MCRKIGPYCPTLRYRLVDETTYFFFFVKGLSSLCNFFLDSSGINLGTGNDYAFGLSLTTNSYRGSMSSTKLFDSRYPEGAAKIISSQGFSI
jgi:hypothetical protein